MLSMQVKLQQENKQLRSLALNRTNSAARSLLTSSGSQPGSQQVMPNCNLYRAALRLTARCCNLLPLSGS
jgi:hypothetical protein